jgi:hypothetical protein
MPSALSTPRMKIVVPPFQTPVSMKSPGTPSSRTLRMQDSTLSRRLAPIIVNAHGGTFVGCARTAFSLARTRSSSGRVRRPRAAVGTG